jgi:hypothetical protein
MNNDETLAYVIYNNEPTNKIHTICHLRIHNYIKTMQLLHVSKPIGFSSGSISDSFV